MSLVSMQKFRIIGQSFLLLTPTENKAKSAGRVLGRIQATLNLSGYDLTMYSHWLSEKMVANEIQTLDRLAALSGINKGTLSRYFRGLQVPSIKAIPALCESLNVSPEELLRGLGVITTQQPQK